MKLLPTFNLVPGCKPMETVYEFLRGMRCLSRLRQRTNAHGVLCPLAAVGFLCGQTAGLGEVSKIFMRPTRHLECERTCPSQLCDLVLSGFSLISQNLTLRPATIEVLPRQGTLNLTFSVQLRCHLPILKCDKVV